MEESTCLKKVKMFACNIGQFKVLCVFSPATYTGLFVRNEGRDQRMCVCMSKEGSERRGKFGVDSRGGFRGHYSSLGE